MKRVLSILAASLCTVLTACGGGGSDVGSGTIADTTPTSRTLRILVTDAPFPYDYVLEASVVIEEVQVHEKDGDTWSTVFTRDGADPDSGAFNLVEYTNGITGLLTEATVPPGTYDEVRLIVNAGRVLVDDAPGRAIVQDGNPVFTTANGKLKFPSGAQTGIKVKIENDIDVVTQLSADLILDFDLTKNFVFNGPITHSPGVKGVLFTPVVRATNNSVAGTLEIEVLSDTDRDGTGDVALAGATVRVFDEGADTTDPLNAIATQSSSDGGFATFTALPPGPYVATAEADGHEAGETDSAVEVFVANLSRAEIALRVSYEIKGNVMSNAGTTGVTETADDWSIGDVSVELRESAADVLPLATTMSDPNGNFQFTELAVGSFHLSFIKTGFDDATADPVDSAAMHAGLTVLMTPKTQTFDGTVTSDSAAGLPGSMTVTVAYNVIVATWISGPLLVSVDGTGAFSLDLPTGSYTLTFDDGDATTPNTPTENVDAVGGEPNGTLATVAFSTTP